MIKRKANPNFLTNFSTSKIRINFRGEESKTEKQKNIM